MAKQIADLESEQVILGTIIKEGSEAFYEVADVLDANTFYYPENKLIFQAIDTIIRNEKVDRPDSFTIIQKIKQIDEQMCNHFEVASLIPELQKCVVPVDNLGSVAKIVARTDLIRNLGLNLENAQKLIRDIDYDQPVLDILGLVEKEIFTFTSKLLNNNDAYSKVAENISEFIQKLAEQKRKIAGIPTGFPLYDYYIGGGLRRGGVNIIGARPKNGKSTIALNIAKNVAKLDIPVLFLDTEMREEQFLVRLISSIAKVDGRDVESGNFANCMEKIIEAEKFLKSSKIVYKNVSGLNHNKIISIAKKWIMKEVGFNAEGNTKDCLIILDYLKVMDQKEKGNDQEYQYLGQMITDLNNFAIQYDVPILTMTQLNRDGISREDSGVVAGSDRLVWLCTSLSILKKKSDEDFAGDPESNGDRKLIIKDCRFGESLEDNQYINLKTDLAKSYIEEGKLNTSLNFKDVDKPSGPAKKTSQNSPFVKRPKDEDYGSDTDEIDL